MRPGIVGCDDNRELQEPNICFQNAIFTANTMIKNIFRKKKTRQTEEPKATQYEFVDWLRYANAGMLMEGNIYSMEYAALHLSSEYPAIEIGSFCGLSTNLINFYLHINGRKNILICSDKWEFENAGAPNSMLGGSSVSFADYKVLVKESFIRNTSLFSRNRLDKTFPVEEFSDDLFRLWKQQAAVKDIFGKSITLGGPISFAYIDGNHSYAFAKRDFENVDQYLVAGGFILFDDSGDGSGWEVCRVIDELKQNGRYEVIVHNPNYLVRKIK